MLQSEFNKKIKALKPYVVYGADDFKEIENQQFSNLVNRAREKSLIVKIGKGKFYRRDDKSIAKLSKASDSENWKFPKRYNNPSKSFALRHDRIRPFKYPIVADLFWSNKYQNIPLDNFISKIIDEDNFYSFPFLQQSFGDRKVIEVYLKNFKSKKNIKENFEEFFYV